MIASVFALIAVLTHELGLLLVDLGIAMGALGGDETPDRAPDVVPDYLLSDH